MSPSAYVTVRETKSGKRYVVRYRVAGRYSRLVHAGSFKTQKDARSRRDFVIAELAAGRDPLATLAALEQKPAARTLTDWAAAYTKAQHQLSPVSKKQFESAMRRWILSDLGQLTPQQVTPALVRELVGRLTATLGPSTVRQYVGHLRKLLDFADTDPNPARHHTVKLPPVIREEPQPPSADQLLKILGAAPRKWRLPWTVMEQTGVRGEAVESLVWGDVDLDGDRFRLRASETKKKRALWVQVPGWLMDLVADTCPQEDRYANRRVFPGLTTTASGKAMERACINAGVPHFTPHELRHRRISLWHQQGVPARELSARVGHARPSVTLDVYSHVMPLAEAPPATLAATIARSP